MKAAFFIAPPLLGAVATAAPAPAGLAANASPMITYCDAENMQGSCTTLDASDERLCATMAHATKSIKVFDGYQCNLFISACSVSGWKVYYAGTYNTIDDLWKESKAIEGVQA
ncbi:hypothetical protein PG994_006992 [Apiospora phragmitis]|uniref:Uncharacterized protein n=1 Tax=Apiospora phragmitis TaxID=2905665 RepID=A0ABR1V2Q5_9PEZI